MASSGDDLSLGPAGEFLRALWRFNHALERISRRMEVVRGVTLQQRLVIRFVGKYPGTTSSQLARYFHLDPGTVSASLARLEQKGLLERRRTHRDRRRVTLGLTPAGRAVDGGAGNDVDRVLESLLRATLLPGRGTSAGQVLDDLAAELEAVIGRSERRALRRNV